jgi:hypothetical protein
MTTEIETDKFRVRKRPEELLSEQDLDLLSGNATRLFCFVWNTMATKELPQVFLGDLFTSRHLQIPLPELNRCQRELQSGLYFEMKFGNSHCVYRLYDAEQPN